MGNTKRIASTGLFDSHGLFTDILNHPALYLNGTAPLNTTGAVRSCVFNLNESTSDPGDCTLATGSDADSFVWCVDWIFSRAILED